MQYCIMTNYSSGLTIGGRSGTTMASSFVGMGKPEIMDLLKDPFQLFVGSVIDMLKNEMQNSINRGYQQ